jgi:ligand-binding sensor domain-containing protein
MSVNKLSYILFLYIVLCYTFTSYAQKPEFEIEKYSSREGLSHNQVFSCTKDGDGFMWFSTTNGLNCFDGYQFKTYYFKKGDEKFAPSNTVAALYTDKAKNLLIGSANGAFILNKKDKTFKPFFSKDYQTQHKDIPFEDGIWKITEDSKGNYWFFTMTKGFYVWNPNSREIVYFHKDATNSFNKIPDNMVRDMQEDSEGNYWICDHTAFIKLTGNPFAPDFTPDYALNSPDDFWIDALILSDGSLLVANFNGGLYLISKQMQKTQDWKKTLFDKTKDLLPKALIRCLYLDSQKRLWVGTKGDGLVLYKNAPNDFQNKTVITDNLYDYTTISHNFVLSIYEDDQHLIWVNTDGAGINKLDEYKTKFASYNRQRKPPYYFPAKTPIGFGEDKKGENLYIGTFLNGFIVKNKATGALTEYKDVGNPSIPLHKYSIRHALVDSIKQHVWLTANGLGLVEFNPQSKVFTPILPPSDSAFLNLKRIGAACLDKKGNIIIGSNPSKRFFVYTIQNNKWASFSYDSLSNKECEVYGITCDTEGNIWMGTDIGLFVFNSQFQLKNHFNKDFLLKNGFFSQINTVYASPDNTIWVGSTNGVIGKWLPNEGKFDTLKLAEDKFILAINQNHQLYELWVSTTNGLYLIDLQRKPYKIQRFDREDGLQENEFNRNSTLKNSEGNLLFGGINGYSVIPITTIEKNQYAPKPHFIDLKVFNQTFATSGDLNHIPFLELKYNQNFFTLFFSMLNFSNTEKNQYEYFLEGFDKKWVVGDKDNFAHYTDVPPGTYTFRLKSTNNDGVKSKEETILKIVITPPVWLTWWFKSLVFLLVAYGLYKLYQYRKKQIEEKQALKQKAIETEMKALRAQMNPHFIFNTLNSINNYIAKEEPDTARSYLTGFAKLMRNILELSREESIRLSSELETVQNFITLERIRFRERFNYHVEIDAGTNTNAVKIPPLILQPFVENAIWHGLLPKQEGGNLWIMVNTEGGKLTIAIEDNGVGRSKSGQRKVEAYRKSYGSAISEERLKLHNPLNTFEIVDKFDDNNQPCGTLVILTFIAPTT